MTCMCKSKVKYSNLRVSVPLSLKDNVMHFFFCYTDQLKCLIEKFTCGCMSAFKKGFLLSLSFS